jgi:NAD-dependent dihydropyrimidine dehydrogenase PreA subunit
MSIESIDTTLCTGCGSCIEYCAMDVIRMDEQNKKAFIKYPEDCMLCLVCEIICPVKAIYVSPEKKLSPLLAWG